MKVNTEQIITNAVCNTTINSTPVPLVDVYGFAIQAVVTGTPNGVIKLQASNDPFKYVVNGGAQTPTHWTDISSSSFTLSSSGVTTWNYNGAFYTFVRVVYTDSSGGSNTAVLNANCTVKGV